MSFIAATTCVTATPVRSASAVASLATPLAVDVVGGLADHAGDLAHVGRGLLEVGGLRFGARRQVGIGGAHLRGGAAVRRSCADIDQDRGQVQVQLAHKRLQLAQFIVAVHCHARGQVAAGQDASGSNAGLIGATMATCRLRQLYKASAAISRLAGQRAVGKRQRVLAISSRQQRHAAKAQRQALRQRDVAQCGGELAPAARRFGAAHDGDAVRVGP
jgi:hypothetical protein